MTERKIRRQDEPFKAGCSVRIDFVGRGALPVRVDRLSGFASAFKFDTGQSQLPSSVLCRNRGARIENVTAWVLKPFVGSLHVERYLQQMDGGCRRQQ
jgi:hypothetical protein